MNNFYTKRKLRKFQNPSQENIFRGYNPFLSNDNNTFSKYLIYPNSRKVARIKLKQANISTYIDLKNTRLNTIPEEVFNPYTPIDGINWWLNVDITKIDASYNYLTENSFDDGVHDFRFIPDVKYLNLSSNKFNFIPKSIFYLKHLVFLDMSDNRIKFIDEILFGKLYSMRNLNLSRNNIKYIPETISNMSDLEELNFSKNEIINLPNELIYLKYLKKLDISWNKIRLIQPNYFSNLYSLEELYCNNNLITNINNIDNFNAFDSIMNLKILNISYNQLNKYIVFRQIPNLEKLNISNNKLENILGLNLCQKLYEINCSNNKIKIFPEDFILIKNLQTLNMQGNELDNLPTLICLMNNLTSLNISFNPMKNSPNLKYANTAQIKRYLRIKLSETDIINKNRNLKNFFYNKIKSIENKRYYNNKININSPIFDFIENDSQLIIKNCELIEIPFDAINNNIEENFLTVIDFSGNQIEKGLENFKYILYLLNNVKLINFSNNYIKDFPISLLTLPTLQELYLSRNFLSYFPSVDIGPYNTSNITQSLLILDLSNNKIEEFPIILGFFNNLKVLNLSSNQINNIYHISKMHFEKLEKFFIDDNVINEIPKNVLYKSIPNIKIFTMSNNYLKDIPSDLFLLFYLEKINFTGNYIRKIDNEILINAYALKNYLQRVHIYTTDEQKYFELQNKNKADPYYNYNYNYNYNSSRFNNMSHNISHNKRYDNNNLFNFKTLDYFNNNNNNTIESNYKIKKNNINSRNKGYNFYQMLNIVNQRRSMEDINNDIYELESEMKLPKLQPHTKANLKKRLLSLIRERADLSKL
jgi:Leucine-rich repeat (LRR) protein